MIESQLGECTGFWQEQLAGLEATPFPRLPAPGHRPKPSATTVHTITLSSEKPFGSGHITLSTQLRLAWAVLISQYTNNPDLVFGTTITGRGAPVHGIERITGPTIATIPLRVKLNWEETVGSHLADLQQQAVRMMPHEQLGLQRISRLSRDAATACQFQSLLVVQPEKEANELPLMFSRFVKRAQRYLGLGSYAVTLVCQLSLDSITVEAIYDPHVLPEYKLQRLLHQLEHVLCQISSKPQATLKELETTSPLDLNDLREWNGALPPRVGRRAHDLVADQISLQPDSLAVCAWDGDLTYSQLDAYTSNLARSLRSLGVTANVFVPLYFEKCRWIAVAIMAVLKAGGAFVLLDQSHPESRLEEICSQIQAPLLITSKAHAVAAERLVPSIVVLDPETLEYCASEISGRHFVSGVTWPDPAPDLPMYAVFTSGSTGKPKGAVMSHINWCTNAIASCKKLELGPGSRVLQFASYSFDASIFEIMLTLTAGGCLCVPSDHDRNNNLAGAMTDLKADWAVLTPSVARILDPAKTHTLKHLILAGEASATADFERWCSSSAQLHIMNAYGPAECTIMVSFQSHSPQSADPRAIGRAHSAVTWVVDPQDHERLAPVGAVGELLVEGEIVGQGYMNDAVKTAATFIEQPLWLQQFRRGPSRVYKTGDLVQYLDDGTLRYVGRKDTQVKIRGQRVELEEVEICVRKYFSGASDVVADMVSSGPGQQPLLAVWIVGSGTQPDEHGDSNENEDHALLLAQPGEGFQRVVNQAISRLQVVLPVFMVPDIFIPINALPLTLSGKVDRHRLRTRTAGLPRETLSALSLKQLQQRRSPVTTLQQRVQALYAETLQVPQETVWLDDHFFRRGGDSILAMRMVALAREAGLLLTVGDIFRHPILVDLADESTVLPLLETVEQQAPDAFALLPSNEVKEKIVSAVVTRGTIDQGKIEDIYPCTPMQDGLMALTLKSPGHYVATWDYTLREDVDLRKLQHAFALTVAANPILRTRLTQCHPHGTFQVVIRDEPELLPIYSTNEECEQDMNLHAAQMGLNTRLWRAAIYATGPLRRLVLVIHHVLYDGESIPLLWDQVRAAYASTSPSPLTLRQYTPFIHYLAQLNGASAFWQVQLQNLEAPTFPPLPSSSYVPQPDAAIHHHIKSDQAINSDYTLSTKLNLSWAILLSQYTDSNDVVFGLTVHGRSAPLSGVEALTGPTVATVPFRVRLIPEQSVEDHLQNVQTQVSAMIPHEQFGLQNIRKLSEDAARACSFQTHFAVQSPTQTPSNSIFTHVEPRDADYQGFSSYAFVFICNLTKDAATSQIQEETSIEVTASYDSNVIPTPQAQRMVEQFEHILQQLIATPSRRIQDISALSHRDMHQLNQLNATLPKPYDRVLHELVFTHADSCPSSPAISAWDGQFTFGQLKLESLQLATILRKRGVKEGSIVPICFEKSKWGIVAMLGVLSIGAALVCIDPKYPPDRLQHIIDQVSPSVILVSPELEEKFAPHRHQASVLVSPSELEPLPEDKKMQSNNWSQNATKTAFIIFTSGSTGQPKGIVMEHRTLALGIRDHSLALGLGQSSRVLHFASYAFDASLYEIFSCLVNGGCLCIPSENQRLNSVEEFMVKHSVNWTLLTPSMLAIVDPGRVPCLQTVAAGGESLTRHVVERWASRVNLINAYSPAEVAICAAGRVMLDQWRAGEIGPILGGVGWVTLSSDPERLAPLGAVGELLIEGPVVSSGYLNRADLTAAGYIDPPAWLVQYRNGKPGRVFRSGDLVEMTEEGCIRIIGRKDTQVKLRGQRIELSEVEYHVRCCFECLDVVVESVRLSGADTSTVLVAFILGSTPHEGSGTLQSSNSTFDIPTAEFLHAAQTAEVSLANSVPSYMIPSLFLPLQQFPQTTGGKVDRRSLRREASLLTPEAIETYRPASAHLEQRQPTTELEALIHTVWARVLNRPATEISVDANFFHLGGDSITAMQLVSHLNSQGIRTTVGAIFNHRTIARLADAITSVSASAEEQSHQQVQPDPEEDQCEVPFELSPIQQLFLDRQPSDHHHFNQSSVVALKTPSNAETLERAIQSLVEYHALFRARFKRLPCGRWQQVIKTHVDGCYRLRQHDNVSDHDAREIFLESQTSLNIETGPLLAADVMYLRDGGQYLSLVAHHLVVDIVSWQIILDTLERYLTTSTVPSTVPLSFQSWCRLQREEVISNQSWPRDVPQSAPGYWGLTDQSNTYGNTAHHGFTLSREETALLLGSANEVFQTRPVELLHAALAYSFAQTFRDRKAPVIFSEGHGRDSLKESIDVTETVGWFTNMWPLFVDLDPQSETLPDALRRVKDRRRKAAAESRHFLANHHHAMIDMELEILFNYSGALGYAQNPESIFSQVSLTDNSVSIPDIGPGVSRFAIFDVLAGVTNSQLFIQFIYPSSMTLVQDTRAWVDTCREALSYLAMQLPAMPRQLTCSDLPLLSLTDDQYQQLICQALNPLQAAGLCVEDVYPVSPIQEGMLLSQAKDAGNYLNQLTWTIRTRDGSPIDLANVAEAWQEVVDKHSLLRTVFRESPNGNGAMLQMVLEDWRASVVMLPQSSLDPLTQLKSHQRLPLPRVHPQHRLTLVGGDDGTAACLLEISHTLLDGSSRHVILRDLARACEHRLDQTPCRVYRDYVEYTQQQDQEQASEYWDRYILDLEPCIFPAVTTAAHAANHSTVGQRRICIDRTQDLTLFCQKNELTISSVLQLAWSLVLRVYCQTDDVCFGYMTSGRDTPVRGIQDAIGPFINLLPCRLRLEGDASCISLLRQCQVEFSQSLQFQYRSLAAILHQHQRHQTSHGPLFNSIMSIQKDTSHSAESGTSYIIEEKDGEDPTEYDLVLSIVVCNETLDISLAYCDSTLTESAAEFVLDAFVQAIKEIIRDSGRPASTIPLLEGSPSETIVRRWNSASPTAVEESATDIILAQCRHQPQAPAICSWDGEFTYQELEGLARRLSQHLRNHHGARDGCFVPIYASKSRWVPVAMLAVALTGAAFVLLDATHPISRLQDICASSNATSVLSLQAQASAAMELGPEVVIIDGKVADEDNSEVGDGKVTIHPQQPLYMIYTSGSTGIPKGVMIDHHAFASSAHAFTKTFRITATSRVLQFASHAFDACIAEILATLTVGGCVCTPSETQRQNALAEATANMKANWMIATASLARVLHPSDYPTLRTMIICAEPVASKEIQRWAPVVDVFLGYGPTECTIFSTGSLNPITPDVNGRDIGRPLGCHAWVVDPANVDILLPVGAVGELLIQGPIVGLGYRNRPDLTATSFIDPPAWARGQTGPRRLYRTGDLVRLTDQGSLEFIRRKDHQVKLRGQRLELGEVEYHLQQCLSSADGAIAEIHKPLDSTQGPALVAFIVWSLWQKQGQSNWTTETSQTGLLGTPDTAFREAVVTAVSKLDVALPVYSVPTVFIPISYIPLTRSGKADRSCLREAVQALSQAEMDVFMFTAGPKSAPETEAERQFAELFRSLFNLKQVGREDNFFRLGGDSILAMQMIPMARKAGFSINMANIFKHPRLCDLADVSRPVNSKGPIDSMVALPFSLLGMEVDRDSLIEEAAQACGVSSAQVEDIYPCTALQEGLMALTTKTHGHSVATFEYQLREDINLDRFNSAWYATAVANPILRTRLLQFQELQGVHQVVLEPPIPFDIFDNPEDHHLYVVSLEERMGLGAELARLSVLQQSNRSTFYLTIHHALYDGESLALLWSQVLAAYNGGSLPLRPFSGFIQHLQHNDDGGQFWRSELANLRAALWPVLPSPQYTPDRSSVYTRSVLLDHMSTEFTTSTLVHLAWASVISCYTDSEDVVYGLTLNGRSAPLPGIEEISGPTIATIPFRMQLNDRDSVRAALTAVQVKAAALSSAQQFGLHRIRRLGAEPARACDFQCHLVIQVQSEVEGNELCDSVASDSKSYAAFGDRALMIICQLGKTDNKPTILVTVNYDSHVISHPDAQRLASQFSHILQQLPLALDLPLNQLDSLSLDDRLQLHQWNGTLPSAVGGSLHDLVLVPASNDPGRPAVSAWDGELSFSALNQLSRNLALQLQGHGVQRGSLVPVCFHRSKWVVVAMLAVLRVGAVCVPLDPGHPLDRIRAILQQTRSKLALLCSTTRGLLAECDIPLLCVPLETDLQEARAPVTLPSVGTHDLAFVMFTSGTTGQPKGILMEHGNLCTSMLAHSIPCNITAETRGLHFSSYAFDASLYEIFTVLVKGGCVCIPSEEDRMNDLPGFIARHRVNSAILAPSLVNRLLQPELLPSLRTLVVGGEALTQDIVDTWASKVALINAYGPAETIVSCAAGRVYKETWIPGQIGPVSGGRGWITVPSDPSRLAIVGAVGELLIEGPIVTRGYLDDPAKTAESFIMPPTWLAQFRGEEINGRLYRTGDLVAYMPDGSLRFVGRKDNQVKLRGQRVELPEVEHHVRRCFSEASEVVAEVVVRDGPVKAGVPSLMAFIGLSQNDSTRADTGTGGDQGVLITPDANFLEKARVATARLMATVPAYMVPTVFLKLARVPRTISGKVDRRQLRELAATVNLEQMQSKEIKEPPRTRHEELLVELWATALQLPRRQIGINDNFYHLGGDSITAMKLSSLARRQGVALSVANISSNPVLADLAVKMHKLPDAANVEEPYRAGSLLGIDRIEDFLTQAPGSSQWPFLAEQVEDILPVTEFQQMYIVNNIVHYISLPIPRTISPSQIEAACRALVHHHPMFRTVFVRNETNLLAVVMRDLNISLSEHYCEKADVVLFADSVCEQDYATGISAEPGYFKPFLVAPSDEQSPHMLILRTTHAHYDGFSIPLLLQDLVAACANQLLRMDIPSYPVYLRYRQRQKTPEVFRFWREYLQGAQMLDFDSILRDRPDTRSDQSPTSSTSSSLEGPKGASMLVCRREIPLLSPPTGITLATMPKAAWALALARLTGQHDIIFGHTLNGRDAPMANIEAVAGPCVTISPMRITLSASSSKNTLRVVDLLHQVQSQHTRSMPFSQLDFQHIREHATDWRPTTQFSSVVTHQNNATQSRTRHPTFFLDGQECSLRVSDYGATPYLLVDTLPLPDILAVSIAGPSSRVYAADVEYLLDVFCQALEEVNSCEWVSI